MILQEGRTYVARNGERFGPMRVWEGLTEDATGGPLFHVGDDAYWCVNGVHAEPHTQPNPGLDIISEWTDGPVRTITRREVVPGVYGRLNTLKVAPSGVSYTKAVVSLEERFYSREDLTEIIDLLAEVRDGLELVEALDE